MQRPLPCLLYLQCELTSNVCFQSFLRKLTVQTGYVTNQVCYSRQVRYNAWCSTSAYDCSTSYAVGSKTILKELFFLFFNACLIFMMPQSHKYHEEKKEQYCEKLSFQHFVLKLKIALFIYTTVFRSLFTPAFRSTKTKKCTNYSHRIIKTGVKDVHNRYIIFTEASNLACLRKMFALNKRNFCRQ